MDRLNRLCNYMIDWTRVGELLLSNNHQYSLKELIPRSFVFICTLAPVIYRGSVNLKSVFESTVCFIISHYIVIKHLIKKRYDTQQDCETLIKSLKSDRCSCHMINEDHLCRVYATCYVCTKIEEIMLSEAPGAKASATWGSRRRMLLNLQSEK